MPRRRKRIKLKPISKTNLTFAPTRTGYTVTDRDGGVTGASLRWHQRPVEVMIREDLTRYILSGIDRPFLVTGSV